MHRSKEDSIRAMKIFQEIAVIIIYLLFFAFGACVVYYAHPLFISGFSLGDFTDKQPSVVMMDDGIIRATAIPFCMAIFFGVVYVCHYIFCYVFYPDLIKNPLIVRKKQIKEDVRVSVNQRLGINGELDEIVDKASDAAMDSIGVENTIKAKGFLDSFTSKKS